jgi:hypothetical protein
VSATAAVLCVALGTGLAAFVVWDVVSTTLTLGEGAGPLTRRVLALGWRHVLRSHRRRENGRSRLLTAAGPLLMVLTVVLWVAVFWAAWSLIFVGSVSVAEANTGRPASVLDVVYFAGTAISTLGVGDFVATTAGWRVVAAAAAFSGLALMTLAITYLFSVMSAVVERRALATQLSALGDTAQDIVAGSWEGARFSPVLTQQLVQLPAQLAAVAEQHLAYPVLHFFRSGRPEAAAPLAIARLDDALLLLQSAVAEPVRPPRAAMVPVRQVIERYLSTASAGRRPGVSSTDTAPPAPGVERLAAAGIPMAEVGAQQRAVEEAAERRTRLRRLVEDAGWEWST